jgi:hypothetical protein
MSLRYPWDALRGAEDEIYRLRVELADERKAHEVTRGEVERLRDALREVVDAHEKLDGMARAGMGTMGAHRVDKAMDMTRAALAPAHA